MYFYRSLHTAMWLQVFLSNTINFKQIYLILTVTNTASPSGPGSNGNEM